jgi:hypothetical protein
MYQYFCSDSQFFVWIKQSSDQAKIDQSSGQVQKYTLLLEDIRNTQYVGTLAIGNPPQNMDVRLFLSLLLCQQSAIFEF